MMNSINPDKALSHLFGIVGKGFRSENKQVAETYYFTAHYLM